eukprot:CAMPEP_0180328500 /NCGR_PEP_ID=MMETSP0988-20121125/40237_1 /TAXON_ID=697907 /ORGANISM="non described non described, Strain CCMP2293" /LENGTH=39 /DNA_ID= /DNA_START= /DNA_END= /DNA_ORIENTATION=
MHRPVIKLLLFERAMVRHVVQRIERCAMRNLEHSQLGLL